MTDRLEVGRVGRAHGLRGEVAVTMTSERPERVEPGAVLYVDDRPLVVEYARRMPKHWLLCFEGVTDRDAAEALHGARLTADPIDDDSVLWVHELVGCVVETVDGASIGVVAAVQANPASDLLVLDGGALVPLVFVRHHEAGRIVVDLPEGLLELNERPDRG